GRGVRVGVDVGGSTVGGPPDVPDAGDRRGYRAGQDLLEQIGQFAGFLRRGQAVRAGQGDSGGVIAAVLQPAQALQHHLQWALTGSGGTCVADYSAHIRHCNCGGPSTCARRYYGAKARLVGAACRRPPTGAWVDRLRGRWPFAEPSQFSPASVPLVDAEDPLRARLVAVVIAEDPLHAGLIAVVIAEDPLHAGIVTEDELRVEFLGGFRSCGG